MKTFLLWLAMAAGGLMLTGGFLALAKISDRDIAAAAGTALIVSGTIACSMALAELLAPDDMP